MKGGHDNLKIKAYSQISTPCRNYAAYYCQKLIEMFVINNKQLNLEEKKELEKKLEEISKHLNKRSKINDEYLYKLNEFYKVKRKEKL